MDSGPQAYGLGRASGQVDLQEFIQSMSVVIRMICLFFSAIIYFSISASIVWVEKEKRNICLYDVKQGSTCCYIGIQIALLGTVLSILLLGAEYVSWKSSSIKMRRRIVRGSLGCSGFEAVLYAFLFIYLFFTYIGTESIEGVSTSNATFAVFILFVSIFTWGYLAYMEYERLQKGVDPEFTGASFTDDPHFSAYIADEDGTQQPTGN